jgi:hypothetical protein
MWPFHDFVTMKAVQPPVGMFRAFPREGVILVLRKHMACLPTFVVRDALTGEQVLRIQSTAGTGEHFDRLEIIDAHDSLLLVMAAERISARPVLWRHLAKDSELRERLCVQKTLICTHSRGMANTSWNAIRRQVLGLVFDVTQEDGSSWETF